MVLRFFWATAPRTSGLALNNALPTARPAASRRKSRLLRLSVCAICCAGVNFGLTSSCPQRLHRLRTIYCPDAPSFAFFAKGGRSRICGEALRDRQQWYPTLRKKREGWGTRRSIWTLIVSERKQWNRTRPGRVVEGSIWSLIASGRKQWLSWLGGRLSFGGIHELPDFLPLLIHFSHVRGSLALINR